MKAAEGERRVEVLSTQTLPLPLRLRHSSQLYACHTFPKFRFYSSCQPVTPKKKKNKKKSKQFWALRLAAADRPYNSSFKSSSFWPATAECVFAKAKTCKKQIRTRRYTPRILWAPMRLFYSNQEKGNYLHLIFFFLDNESPLNKRYFRNCRQNW